MKEKLYLTSRQNPTIKWLSSLSEKKYRDESQSFLLEGKKLCEEGMRAGLAISHIVVREDNHEWQSLALQYCQTHEDTQFIVTNDSCFSKISQEKSPEGVIIVAKYLDNFKYYYIINNNTLSDASFSGIVLLDAVRDPGNLGAILRTAAAFGVSHVILSADCADLFHPRTLRAAMGAFLHLQIWQVGSLSQAISALREQGRAVYAARLSDDAMPLSSVSLTPADAVVIGNEGHGISEAAIKECTKSVYIPVGQAVESLNASVAASILIWEQMKGTRLETEKGRL